MVLPGTVELVGCSSTTLLALLDLARREQEYLSWPHRQANEKQTAPRYSHSPDLRAVIHGITPLGSSAIPTHNIVWRFNYSANPFSLYRPI
eukprot:scaffold23141_cov133-Skeletonema_marinoi.AAC.4